MGARRGDRSNELLRTAELFYLKKWRKNKIAEALGVSPTQIANWLQEANALGFVKVSVERPPRPSTSLEQELHKCYPHLQDIVIVPTAKDYPRVHRSICLAAAEYFESHVLDDSNLALSGGSMILGMIENIEPSQRALKISSIAFNHSGPRISHVESYVLAALLSFKCQSAQTSASGVFLPPLSHPSQLPEDLDKAGHALAEERRDYLEKNTVVRDLYETMQRADYDWTFIGCAPLRHPHVVEEPTAAALEARGLGKSFLENRGIIGNINGWVFDEQLGHQISPFLTLRLSRLQELVKRERNVVLLAGGSFKAKVIRAALQHALCSVVITDRGAAEEVLKLSAVPTSPVKPATTKKSKSKGLKPTR